MNKSSHNQNGLRFATKAIHAAQGPEEITGAVTYPIFQTSTYAYLEPGKHKGYDYSRTANPTRKVLEENFAALNHDGYREKLLKCSSAKDALRLVEDGEREILK